MESKDSDLDTVDTTGDGAKTGADGVGIDMEAGIGGGALLGGEPENSVFVTKKNSPAEPPLF